MAVVAVVIAIKSLSESQRLRRAGLRERQIDRLQARVDAGLEQAAVLTHELERRGLGVVGTAPTRRELWALLTAASIDADLPATQNAIDAEQDLGDDEPVHVRSVHIAHRAADATKEVDEILERDSNRLLGLIDESLRDV